MKRSLIVVPAILALLAGGLAVGPHAESVALAAPAPKKTPDPCAHAKSKWQRMQCEEYDASAPGDQYFGRLKLSYLGIDNTFRDMAIEAGDYTTSPAILSRLHFALNALRQWEQLYPHDPQLSRTYFLGVQVYRKVYTQHAQQIAWDFIQKLLKNYPNDYFGKIMKADTAHGFTEHWFAQAQPCPTPLPKGATPAPPTPTPSPSPTPRAGQPNVQILTPPCIPPPSPSPSPSAAASSGPAVSPSP